MEQGYYCINKGSVLNSFSEESGALKPHFHNYLNIPKNPAWIFKGLPLFNQAGQETCWGGILKTIYNPLPMKICTQRVFIHAFKQGDSLGVCITAHDVREEWDLLIGTRPQDILSLSKCSYTVIF